MSGTFSSDGFRPCRISPFFVSDFYTVLLFHDFVADGEEKNETFQNFSNKLNLSMKRKTTWNYEKSLHQTFGLEFFMGICCI